MRKIFQKSAQAPWLNRKSCPGFTMIELLVVATIMIILTTIGLISYQNTMRNARNGKRRADLESVRSALVLYRSDFAGYPDGDFSAMLADLVADEYLSVDEVVDPKNAGVYIYSYDPDNCAAGLCRTFELCGYEEPDPGTSFCLRNP